jgi:hypothetical protein
MSEFISRTPLTEEEMRQLRDLLVRYLAYHAVGLANLAIDGLIAQFRKGKVIEHIPQDPVTVIEDTANTAKAPARAGRRKH